ncbi:hypothetical protein KSF78_0008420 [Schistosoma japonicum]|nr:hypothetical protein KSF78_0008420 [Schistosoma japonicum]
MSSSSSSSSLLYINVLLLVLIHSSIQQGLIEEYQQNFTTSENNLNQSINKVCETRLLTIEFIVRSLRASVSKEKIKICDEPENIDLHGNAVCIRITLNMHTVFVTFHHRLLSFIKLNLTIVDKLLLKYLNDKNYFQLNKCKIDDTLYYNR